MKANLMEKIEKFRKGELEPREVRAIEFKWKPNPILKNIKYIETTDKTEKKQKWSYKPRLEEAIIQDIKSENPKFKNIKFLDKSEKEVLIDINELQKYDYVKEQRPELAESKEKEKIPKTPLQDNRRDVNICTKEFEKFYHFLMKNAPEGYVPWFFPLEPFGKDPCAKAILKINPNSKGSWHHESARLTKEQCVQLIKEGYNIGISARTGDALILGDIDNPEFLNQFPKETLTTTSRKRVGGHFFGWDKDGSAKKNIPTDDGELRSNNQYVVACGSYVPFNLENKKDLKAFNELPSEAVNDELLGYYSVREAISPRELSFSDLPEFFIKKYSANIEADNKIKIAEEQKSYKEFIGEGKYSELLKLKVTDIIGLIPASKRVGHPLHESDTDANFSLSKDGTLGHCWRHLVSLNAVQYLCVQAGYSKCEDAGTPHKNNGKLEEGRQFSKIKGDKKALEVAYNEAVKLGLIKEWKPKEYYSLGEEKTSEKYIRFGKFGAYVDVDFVVNKIRETNNFKTIYGKTSEEIFYYDDGIYKPNGREIIQTEVEDLLNTWAKTKVVNEIVAKIKRQTAISRKDFDDIPKELLPLRNGILNFKTGEFIEYSPDYYFKTKIDVQYDKNAECSKWKKFIKQTFYEDDVKVIQEWWGFCLYREYFIKKGFIGFGKTNTGKSVFQNVLLKFFGIQNTCGVPLQKLNKPFSISSLYNKYVNLYDDLSSNDLNDVSGFKMVTGRSPITAEYKFGDEFQFINTAKMTFCCNKIPPISEEDFDEAYFIRWIAVPFDNVVTETERDNFLTNKLTTDNELSGILNWALDGLKSILATGKFSYEKTAKEIKDIMDRNSVPLAEFAKSFLMESPIHKITKETMFEYYTEWAKKYNKPRETIENLGRQLPRYVDYIRVGREGNTRYWDNVKFVENNDTYDTFKNIKGKQGVIIYYNPSIVINKKIVSYVSPKQDFSIHDLDKQIQEVLEDE